MEKAIAAKEHASSHVRGDSLITIKDGDELRNLLHKALEVETTFESVAQWEGYVTTRQDELREVLFSLISDSEGHRRIVESLLDKARTSGESTSIPIKSKEIIPRGNSDLEMMTQISKMEMLMYNLYSDIKKAFVASETELLLNDKSDAKSFLSAIDSLIQDEAKHMEMVSQYVRNVERLR